MLLLALAACTDALAPVTDVGVDVHPDVATVLTVAWTQVEAAEGAAIEYRFEGDTWLSTPAGDRGAGAHAASVLGVPPDTTVELRFVGTVAGEAYVQDDGLTGTTGPLPADFPTPTLVTWEPDLASDAGWLYTTVATGESNYEGPWWAYILDRQARIVWYYPVEEDRQVVMSRVAADGTHLTWGEVSWFGDPSTLRRATLDFAWEDEIALPAIGYTYAEQPDGTIAYDAWTFGGDITLRTVAPDGTLTDVWSCTAWAPQDWPWNECGTNTVHWDEDRGTFLWSQYATATVLEVDPVAGEAVASWGDFGDQPILTDGVGLQMQHYPNWTEDGTLLLHTQEPGDERIEWAREFTVDEATGGLEQVWSYATTERYAECSGEAVRLDNGNTLLNYGCGAAIREITSEGEVAWDVETHELIGHQTLIADLYAVNRGR